MQSLSAKSHAALLCSCQHEHLALTCLFVWQFEKRNGSKRIEVVQDAIQIANIADLVSAVWGGCDGSQPWAVGRQRENKSDPFRSREMRCDQVGLSGSDGENRSTVVPHRLLLSIGRHSAIGGWRNLGVPPSSGGYPHPLTAFFGFFIGRRLLFHLMLGWQLIESTGDDL